MNKIPHGLNNIFGKTIATQSGCRTYELFFIVKYNNVNRKLLQSLIQDGYQRKRHCGFSQGHHDINTATF